VEDLRLKNGYRLIKRIKAPLVKKQKFNSRCERKIMGCETPFRSASEQGIIQPFLN